MVRFILRVALASVYKSSSVSASYCVYSFVVGTSSLAASASAHGVVIPFSGKVEPARNTGKGADTRRVVVSGAFSTFPEFHNSSAAVQV